MTQETKNAELSAANRVYIVNNGNLVFSRRKVCGDFLQQQFKRQVKVGPSSARAFFSVLHLNATQVHFKPPNLTY